jgi:type III secretion protein V
LKSMSLAAYLENLLRVASGRRELVVVVLIVTAIGEMVMPITPGIADILISINIGISVVLLMVAFHVHTPTDFAALPSIVLITTVFRLSISVAVTRLILIEAEGGRIVQTFGDFVISGNVAVGMIVFLIITIVQFVVITKGSERVAEVAARFSLDGLPGKQMSIDSDLRNGDIDQHEARRRRQNLERESQLFGSMDGAMKFVKGDAIAGIVIIVINLIGGIGIGMAQRHLSFGDSTHVFSLLTVGEGLIAQIPALFISLTAGTIVTRVSGTDKINIGTDIISQIASRPDALRMAAVVLVGLALVPGFPSAIFLTFAAILGLAGTLLLTRERRFVLPAELVPSPTSMPAISALMPGQMPAAVAVLVSPAFAARVPEKDIQRSLAGLAHSVAQNLGFATPSIGYRVDNGLSGVRYTVELDMVPEIIREVSFDQVYAAALDMAALQKLGLSPLSVLAKPSPAHFALPAESSETLKAASVQFFTPQELLENDVLRLLRGNAAYFVGIQETRRLLAAIEGDYKDLLREVQRIMGMQRIADVLRKLLEEGVPIRNLRLILEAILEWAPREADAVVLTGHVRQALKRQICFSAADAGKVIHAFIVERAVEDMLRKATQDATAKGQPMLDVDLVTGFRETFEAKRSALPRETAEHLAVLVSADLRRLVWSMLSQAGTPVPVLSYQEIATDFSVQTHATLGPPARRDGFAQSSAGLAPAPLR